MRVHLVAACGTAMGTLAGILQQQGFTVTGSDQNTYPPMSEQLEKWGIRLFSGYSAEHLLPAPDLVVIGNAVRKDNVEARAAIDGGLAYTSFTSALGRYFLNGKQPVVVAGTHGKTTTTSLLAHVFTAAGSDPSVFVGGVAKNLSGSFRIGTGPLAFVEGDEYDTAFFDKTPKFWHYNPKHALLTHLEYDHADIYADFEAVLAAFARFVQLLPKEGSLTACVSVPGVRRLLQEQVVAAPVSTYSLSQLADWTVRDVRPDAAGAHFTALQHGAEFGEFFVPLAGSHNIENALGVVATAATLGLPSELIASGLASFAGVKRRLEERGRVRDIIVVDDFAHHPTAVKATLQATRQRYPNRRILAVFEPRSQTSRRKVFQHDYEEAFATASASFFSRPFGIEALAEDERFDSAALATALRQRGQHAVSLDGADAIVAELKQVAKPGDVILVMSNGAFANVHEKILAAL